MEGNISNNFNNEDPFKKYGGYAISNQSQQSPQQPNDDPGCSLEPIQTIKHIHKYDLYDGAILVCVGFVFAFVAMYIFKKFLK